MAEVKHTHEHVEHAMIHDSYAVDETNEPVTVLGTFGQDPDHQTEKIGWRTWLIVALCALAQLQNTYIRCGPSLLPLLSTGRTSAPLLPSLFSHTLSLSLTARTDAERPASQRRTCSCSLLDRGLAKRLRRPEDLDHPGKLFQHRSQRPVRPLPPH